MTIKCDLFKMNIPAGQFKAKCLKLMDEVKLSKQEIVITKYGKAVAKLVPIKTSKPKGIFALLKGSVNIKGDLLAPIQEPWNALE